MASLMRWGKETELPHMQCQAQSREAAGSQHAAMAREGTSFKISGTNLVSLSLSLFHMKVCKRQISK